MDQMVLLERLPYAREVRKALRVVLIEKESWIRGACAEAYRGEAPAFPVCALEPLMRLAVVHALLAEKEEAYRAKGASEAVMLDTFADVPLRAGLYFSKRGEVGITADDAVWLRHIMAANLFKLGAVQFQPFEMIYLDKETIGEDYMHFGAAQKAALPPGTPVLNCHIQTGVHWDKPGIDAAFAKADRFFGTQYQAYLCYSWLLYPPMLRHLPVDSNIRHFAQQFRILSSCNDTDQARENLQPHTRLHALLQEQPESFGYACGVRER